MSAAGMRVRQLWLEATRENIEASCEEAERLAPQLEAEEVDYLEGLANVREVLLRDKDAAPRP